MGVVKSLWASVQGNPVFMRRVNGWLTIVWLVMIPVSLYIGWVKSVVYVSALSLWALVSGHWSAWQAARVEVNQQVEIEAHQKEDLAGEVVERVIEETDVKPSAGDAARSKAAATIGFLRAAASRTIRNKWSYASPGGPNEGPSSHSPDATSNGGEDAR